MDRSDSDDPVKPPNQAPSSRTPEPSPSPPPSALDSTIVMSHMGPGLAPGQILGHRYRIVTFLGRGGMGEVWQAYDLKLQVEVALKSILAERFPGEQGLELLRREVRAAREVMSPNVCRIFDLIDAEGHEYVSMEYVDGETLLELLREQGPLELQKATRLASQFLAGLEAIHLAGLVHRDVKPENVMITRTGRVVLMDFGVAKGIAEGHRGTIAGTPAYMAPEQQRGEALDARADIFAAGVVLAEMIAPEGIRERESRAFIWQAVRQAPPKLFESPWRGVLERAVAGDRSQRYDSAQALARALEEVTLRVAGAEYKRPYPGLESFTEADAEFFFGRELEVEAVWSKLQRASLLAIIGASGAGKSSFLHAGLIPAKPADWRHAICRPGSSPLLALARALVPHFSGDMDTIQQLMQPDRIEPLLDACGRWRQGCREALLVIDQFEELFTLCRPEVQATFADLLGRVAAESDVHVLLVMRDDFLIGCHDHPRLAPISSNLTMLGPPTGSALRRALVQPALLCGYRFEDESLADEMLAAIKGERGALPMLAFAAAQLWEQRDRERGLLTREAYEQIGGVTGALAQHAETTLERIGSHHHTLVREIFRNLVTAQGTRAAIEVEELLSVFEDRGTAESVVRELVDARLLTTFETEAEEKRRRRVEIVHESLLQNWPRLVHWRTQDTEGAQFRDQLRQQTRLWEERGRPDDLLWTGRSYREFAVWRERYSGGLTATEEAFASAMVGQAGRQRRRRRIALVTAFTALVAVVLVIGWYARAEKLARLSAEASGLIALGRAELEDEPSAALAYAIASLERADTPSNRYFALEALSRGPAAWILPLGGNFGAGPMSFSPDGSRLAVGGWGGAQVLSRDGATPVVMDTSAIYSFRNSVFYPDGDRVVIARKTELWFWSLSQGKVIRELDMKEMVWPFWLGGRMTAFTSTSTSRAMFDLPDDASEPVLRARLDLKSQGVTGLVQGDVGGKWMSVWKDRQVYVSPFNTLFPGGADARPDWDRAELVGEHPSRISAVTIDSTGTLVASADQSGEIRVWSRSGPSYEMIRVFRAEPPVTQLAFNPSRTMLAGLCTPNRRVHLWDLEGPRDAAPRILPHKGNVFGSKLCFDPTGQWLFQTYTDEIAIWPVERPGSYTLKGRLNGWGHGGDGFTPDGDALIGSLPRGKTPLLWNLHGEPTRDLLPVGTRDLLAVENLILDPSGQFAAVKTEQVGKAGDMNALYVVSLAGGSGRKLAEGTPGLGFHLVGWSPDGRFLSGLSLREDGRCDYRLWDVATGAVRILQQEPGDIMNKAGARFSADGSLFMAGGGGVIKRWNPADGAVTTVAQSPLLQVFTYSVSWDGRYVLAVFDPDTGFPTPTTRSELKLFDLRENTVKTITNYGNNVNACVLDTTGAFMAALDVGGAIRVGRVGEEPHVVICPPGLNYFAMSPDWRWMALGTNPENTSADTTITIWPVPEGRPIQSRSHKEFLEYLRARTNLRVVADKATLSGYRVEKVPFAGWGKIRAR
jgi:WD40 repeat protein